MAESGASRLALAAASLAALWIAVFWLTPVDRRAPITAEGAVEEESASASPEVEARAAEPAIVEAEPAEPAAPVERPAGVVAPEFDTHLVRANETMETIAERYYGRASLWSVVARANPSVDPMKLRVGVELRIPRDPANVQGLPVTDGGGAPAATPDPPVEYVVRSGDTLSEIAAAHYGSSRLWRVILDANRDKIRSATDIRPGMRLVIPASPRPAQGGP